jgi:hypothetical protein
MKEQIIEIINNMTGSELIELNNRYCQEFGYENDIYYNDEEFFNIFFERKPMEVARAIYYGDYRFMDDFVTFNGYGNLVTFSSIDTDRLVDLVETMAENIAEKIEEFEDIIRLTDED